MQKKALNFIQGFSYSKMVPEVGIEPTLPYGNKILSLARLPIPPLWLVCTHNIGGILQFAKKRGVFVLGRGGIVGKSMAGFTKGIILSKHTNYESNQQSNRNLNLTLEKAQ